MTDQASHTGLILLVDDDPLLCELHQRWLEPAGFTTRVFHDGASCLAALTEVLPDAVCLDLVLPGLSGLETLRRIKAHHPNLPVVVMTAHAEVETAVQAIKLGAYDYLEKPVDRTKFVTELQNTVERNRMTLRLAQLEREVDGRGYPGIIGESPALKNLFRQLDRVAPSDITVLIQGESGTGKELVARALHLQSTRSANAFVPLSCAAVPESLQESELFGHEKGAFTGATSRRLGVFERAHGGTVLLDEIGELTGALQAKLLRVLQERSFQRVGGAGEVSSDFRLIAATHRDLAEEVRRGRFREDLYFRVAVIELDVPPLRERRSDIPILATHFLRQFTRKKGSPKLDLSRESLDLLAAYSWPGNVRELQNAIERAVVVAQGRTVRPTDFPSRLRSGETTGTRSAPAGFDRDTSPESSATDSESQPAQPPVQTLDEIERDAIIAALARHNGNISQVVRELGIGRTTLYRKLKRYNIR